MIITSCLAVTDLFDSLDTMVTGGTSLGTETQIVAMVEDGKNRAMLAADVWADRDDGEHNSAPPGCKDQTGSISSGQSARRIS